MKGYKILVATLMALVIFTGCGVQDMALQDELQENEPSEAVALQTDEKKPPENKMIIAMDVPTTLNPLYNTQENVEQALYLMFSPLINIEENGTISANVAHSWMVNENNTAVTLTLDNTIKWHDGKALTTDDVIFSIEQIQAISESPYKQTVENISSVEKIDDKTLKIFYKQSFSGMLQTLFFPIIPKHVYDVPESSAMTINPIGSGPFKFKSMTPLKHMQLEANQDYFRGAPQIEAVEVSIIPDEESSLHAFKQDLIDVVYTDITEWGKYANDKSSKIHELTSNIYEFMGLNFNKAVFQNANVRKALMHGLDREEMIYLYYLDHAAVTDTPISPSSYLYDKGLPTQGYDKEKSKLLLTQEGYERDGKTGLMTKNEIPLAFTLIINAENRDRVKIAGEIKKMYKEIGVEVTVQEFDRATYLSKIETRQYDAFLGGWQLSYALDLSFAFHSSQAISGQNYVNYKDSKMDELLQQSFLATESNILESYAALQQFFAEQNPYISLYFKKKVLLTKGKITGDIKPTPLNVFSNVELWAIE
jgi:peptide/nickel transport system substrate-binding protein